MTEVFTVENKHLFEEVKACLFPREIVEDFAEYVAEVAKVSPGSPLPPFVEGIGGKIVYREQADLTDKDGSLVVKGKRDFTIYLASTTSPLRDRFTIAHELGHYFLHSGAGERKIQVQRHNGGRAEWEANWFAAALLMPKAQFIEVFNKSPEIEALAKRFDVSYQAAQIRVRYLGLQSKSSA